MSLSNFTMTPIEVIAATNEYPEAYYGIVNAISSHVLPGEELRQVSIPFTWTASDEQRNSPHSMAILMCTIFENVLSALEDAESQAPAEYDRGE